MDRRKESTPKSRIRTLTQGDISIGICQHRQKYMLSRLRLDSNYYYCYYNCCCYCCCFTLTTIQLALPLLPKPHFVRCYAGLSPDRLTFGKCSRSSHCIPNDCSIGRFRPPTRSDASQNLWKFIKIWVHSVRYGRYFDATLTVHPQLSAGLVIKGFFHIYITRCLSLFNSHL